jgi:hypothetical protein
MSFNSKRGYNVTPFTLALNGAVKYQKVYSCLDSMLTKNTLNTSDITHVMILFKHRLSPLKTIFDKFFFFLCKAL